MFMGDEFGQYIEWRDDQSLDWMLLEYPKHAEVQRMVRDLNRFYTTTGPMYRADDGWNGFLWLKPDDNLHSALAWMRMDERGHAVLCAFNFTPVPQEDYAIGVKKGNTALLEAINQILDPLVANGTFDEFFIKHVEASSLLSE